jgi:hypothetical protein
MSEVINDNPKEPTTSLEMLLNSVIDREVYNSNKDNLLQDNYEISPDDIKEYPLSPSVCFNKKTMKTIGAAYGITAKSYNEVSFVLAGFLNTNTNEMTIKLSTDTDAIQEGTHTSAGDGQTLEEIKYFTSKISKKNKPNKQGVLILGHTHPPIKSGSESLSFTDLDVTRRLNELTQKNNIHGLMMMVSPKGRVTLIMPDNKTNSFYKIENFKTI